LICIKGARLTWGILGAAMSRRLISAGRGAFLALAVTALAITLLRPGCELGFTHAGGADRVTVPVANATVGPVGTEGPAMQCCAGVTVPARESIVLAAAGWPVSPGVASLALFFLVPASISRRTGPRMPPPRGTRSFYLRSARILR